MDNFEEEVSSLIKLCDKIESPIVFLHADLQPGNLMHRGSSIRLIDFE